MEFWVNILWARVCRSMQNRVLVVVILAAGVLMALAAQAQPPEQLREHGIGGLGVRRDALLSGLARTIFSFGLGLGLYRVRGWLPRLPAAASWLLLITVPVALLFDPGPQWRLTYDLVFVAALSPALVAAGASAEPATGQRIFSFLGAVSYPIYVLHLPLISAFVYVRRLSHVDGTVIGLTLLATLLIVGWIADKVDIEVRRRIMARLSFRRASREAIVAEPAAP